MYSMKKGGKAKTKKGGFPDLNKDGKVSKADILIGRGVISKKRMGGSCGTPKRLSRGK